MAARARRYSREFKISAVRLVQEQGYGIAEAARSLGVDDQCIRYWIKQFKDQVGQPVGDAAMRSELQRLREENRRLLMEREILKKAATFFAREQP